VGTQLIDSISCLFGSTVRSSASGTRLIYRNGSGTWSAALLTSLEGIYWSLRVNVGGGLVEGP